MSEQVPQQDRLAPLTQAEVDGWQAPLAEDRNIAAGAYLGNPLESQERQDIKFGYEPDFYSETGKTKELNKETERFYKMEKRSQPRLRRFGRALVKFAGYGVAAGYLGKEQVKSHFYDALKHTSNATSIVSEKLSPKLADLSYKRGGENKWRELSGGILSSASRSLEKTSFSAAALAGSSKEKARLALDNTLHKNDFDNASRFTKWAVNRVDRITDAQQEDRQKARRIAERNLGWRHRNELKEWHRTKFDEHNRRVVGSIYEHSTDEARQWTGSDNYTEKFARKYAVEADSRPQYAEYALSAAALTGGVDKDGTVTLLGPAASANRIGTAYSRNTNHVDRVGAYEQAYLSGIASLLHELGYLNDDASRLKEGVVSEETSDPGTNWRNRQHIIRVRYDESNPLHVRLAGMNKSSNEAPNYIEVVAKNDSNYENSTVAVRAVGDAVAAGELRTAA